MGNGGNTTSNWVTHLPTFRRGDSGRPSTCAHPDSHERVCGRTIVLYSYYDTGHASLEGQLPDDSTIPNLCTQNYRTTSTGPANQGHPSFLSNVLGLYELLADTRFSICSKIQTGFYFGIMVQCHGKASPVSLAKIASPREKNKYTMQEFISDLNMLYIQYELRHINNASSYVQGSSLELDVYVGTSNTRLQCEHSW